MGNQGSGSVPGVTAALAGAIVLAISCFLPWWDQGGGFGDLQEAASGSSGLTAFEVPLSALIVIGCAIGAIILALRVRGNPTLAAEGFQKSGITILGSISLLVVLLGLISPPEPTAFGQSLGDPADPTWGIWVALIAAAAVIYGGVQVSKLNR